MGQKQQTVTIDGDLYEMKQLGFVQGLALFHELRRMAMPFLRDLVSDPQILAAFNKSGEEEDKALADNPVLQAKLARLVFTLFESLDSAFEHQLVAAFAQQTRVQIGQVFVPMGDARQPNSVIDQHFAGRWMSYQKWLVESAKFNFAGFLGSSPGAASPSSVPTP